MMRKIIIAGNWKMYKSNLEAIDFVNALKRQLYDINEVDIVVCAPFTALSDLREVLNDANIGLGAQNCYFEEEGAFTGEVSAKMLKGIGVEYVIIGHSERRQHFGETNENVYKKIKTALTYQLTPIVCIGENLKEREGSQTFQVIKNQCEGSLGGLSAEDIEKIIIAYEPVWAIGTGKTATAAQAQEVHKFIRELMAKMYNEKVAMDLRIQYGGSVKPENITELVSQADIDGALVGGASLKEDSFVKIVKNCCGVMSKIP